MPQNEHDVVVSSPTSFGSGMDIAAGGLVTTGAYRPPLPDDYVNPAEKYILVEEPRQSAAGLRHRNADPQPRPRKPNRMDGPHHDE